MKKIIYFLMLFAFSFAGKSQDLIFLNNGQKLETKVVAVEQDLIRYTYFYLNNNQEYTVEKSKVLRIEYQDGRIETFRSEASPTEKPKVAESPAPPTKESAKTKKRIQLGAFAGINAATGLYNYKAGPEPPVLSLLPAASIGININFSLVKAVSLETALAYRGKGDQIDMADWFNSFELPPSGGVWEVAYPEADGTIKTYLGYAEMGLYPVFAFSESIRLGLGAYAAAGLHGKETSDFKIDYYLNGELISSETVKESRNIEFVDLISLEDSDEVRYINRLDYGFTGFMDFGKQPLTWRLTAHYGMQTWEPENDLFGSGNKPEETYHLTGMFSLHYWFGK